MENNKHYIRMDDNNRIIKGFSNAFEQPLDTDICINEQGGRHFELKGVINPAIFNENGLPIYKYENGEIVDGISDVDLLKQAIQSKITELSNTCKEHIIYGFVASNGNGYRLTVEDQLNMQGQKNKLDSDSSISTVDWLTIEDLEVSHTRDGWLIVYEEAFNHKDNAIWKNKQLREQAKSITITTTLDDALAELDAIVW